MLGGRYVLEQELGRSRIGITFRATDTVLERSVVVKLIHPDLARDPIVCARLESAARAVAGVSDPGLVRMLDTGTEGGVPFVVREHPDGESVRDRLDRDGPLNPIRATAIIREVLRGVAALHGAGVVHGGIKPENVVVSEDGTVRVCDAAIAAAVLGDRGGDVSIDVRDTAALLFEALTGRPPTPDATSPRALRRDVPRELDDAVRRALTGGSISAEDLAARLHQIAGAEPGLRSPGDRQHPFAPPPTAPRWFRTWVAVPLLVLLIAIAAVAAGLRFGELELGGPVGIQIKRDEPSPVARPVALDVVAVSAFDPFGDGSENDDSAPLAADGNALTAWRSENYFDGRLNKPGVGLLFDFGEQRSVTGFRLTTSAPGFAFAVAVGDDPVALAGTDLRPTFTATADVRGTLGPATGRYVLLWFTTVIPTEDGNRVVVDEFKAVGRS